MCLAADYLLLHPLQLPQRALLLQEVQDVFPSGHATGLLGDKVIEPGVLKLDRLGALAEQSVL
jgi:hypothetical protein